MLLTLLPISKVGLENTKELYQLNGIMFGKNSAWRVQFSYLKEYFIQLSFASRQSESGEICLFFKKIVQNILVFMGKFLKESFFFHF